MFLGIEVSAAALKRVWKFLEKKTRKGIPYDLAILVLCVYSKDESPSKE